MRVWINGTVLADPDQPSVAARDHGMTVGDGVFETVKIEDGEPFALQPHLDRLDRSAAGLGLVAPDHAAVRAGIDAVREGIEFGRLRITYTAGPGPLGSARTDGAATLVVAAEEMQRPEATTKVVIAPWRRNEHSAVAGLKTTSYAENVVALAYAIQRNASEAILANTAGNVCEGTGSNLFYVIDGEVRTPTLDSGCLAGTTRAMVLQWCPWIVEIDEPIEVLDHAEELFLTSSLRDAQPVRAVDDRRVDAPGPQTLRVMEEWAKRTASGR